MKPSFGWTNPTVRIDRAHQVNGWSWRQRLSKAAQTLQQSADGPAVRSPKMARVEAALFVADGALSIRKLVQLAKLTDIKEARQLIDELNASYDEGDSAFRIEHVAAGVQLLTIPKLASWLDRIHNRQQALKLSPPAMETLSIIAYKQPCTRADVESVRGVQSSEMIKQLLERNLIRISGEDDSLGRPYLYSTTRLFLESFGLSKLDDLPMADTLRPKPEPEAVEDEETGEDSGETESDPSADDEIEMPDNDSEEIDSEEE